MKAKSRIKRRRKPNGRYAHSWAFHFAPLIYLIISVLFMLLLQHLFTEEPLVSPCPEDGCKFNFSAKAYEGTVITITAIEQVEPKIAKITAYSCNGIKDTYHLLMNCPSIKHYGEPRTANGTTPIIDKTMACDPANMGKTFEIEGIGTRTCTDTGGAIKGAGRFDLYVKDINTAYGWGTQYIKYSEVN